MALLGLEENISLSNSVFEVKRRKIIEMELEEKVEIVVVGENKLPKIKELSKEIMQLAVPMQMTFEKKKKHQIKGHKHQYKFHP